MTLDEKLAKLEGWERRPHHLLQPPPDTDSVLWASPRGGIYVEEFLPTYNTLDALFRVCKSQGWEVVLIQYTDGWCMASLRNMNMVRYNESPIQALRNVIEKVVG